MHLYENELRAGLESALRSAGFVTPEVRGAAGSLSVLRGAVRVDLRLI